MAHLFAHMDAELRAELSDVGWWIDTSLLSVDESVDRLMRTESLLASWATDEPCNARLPDRRLRRRHPTAELPPGGLAS